jgi:hypothetical protein
VVGSAAEECNVSDGPASGWYADPLRRFDHRYWDGTAWTEHVARAGVAAVDPPTASPVATAGTATGPVGSTATTVNVLAVVSLVLSIIWVGGLASLAAIVTGVMARRQIRDAAGRETGEGAALAGIIIGSVGVVLTAVAVLAMVLFFAIPTTPSFAP